MEILYHPYEILATGGAIGDVLFFFCSGFTLFLGKMRRFDNWYKRRINRIYPTVIAYALIGSFLLGHSNDIKHVVLLGGGWFVSCIMLYYIVFYFIRKFAMDKLEYVFVATSLIIIVYYLLMNRPDGFDMYGNTYFKWVHYFLFMLLGAMLGISQKKRNYRFIVDFLKLMGCIILYYGYLFIGRKISLVEDLQILSLIPLLGITFYFYKICNSKFMYHLYEKKISGFIIRFIGGLCLEIYLIQGALLSSKMNSIFPLNIPIMFIIITVAAYFLRSVARFFTQTFREEDYNWKNIFKLYL